MQNGTAPPEDSLTVLLNHMTQKCYSWVFLPWSNENLCSHENLYTDIYSSHIHNCPKLETTTMLFHWRMDNQLWPVCTAGNHLVIKRNAPLIHRTIGTNRKDMIPISKDYIPYCSTYMIFLKWQSCRDEKHISFFGSGEWGSGEGLGCTAWGSALERWDCLVSS